MSTKNPAFGIDLNHDGTVSVKERFLSIVAVWGFSLAGLIVVYFGVCRLVEIPGREAWARLGDTWLAVISIAATIPLIVLVILRTALPDIVRLIAAWHGYQQTQRDRILFEESQKAASEYTGEKELTEAEVDEWALRWLKRAYTQDKVSRADWVNDNLPERVWNRVNKLMTERGIRDRKGGTLTHLTIEEAWAAWLDWKIEHRNQLRRVGDTWHKG